MTSKIIPRAAITICVGMAVFISFFTPESDVYVEEPVKFIAIKEDMEETIMNQAIISYMLFPLVPRKNIISAVNAPAKNPLTENLFPGSHGKRAGVIIIPAQ